jgi:lycopene cyclase domain-containing protein
MTYLQFHLVAILPPLAVMGYLAWPSVRALGRRALWSPLLIAVIAVLYTTPWDNYLVANGIWWYGEDRVLGTIGYVPVEEYAFFVLQTILTSCVYFYFLNRPGLALAAPAESSKVTARAPGAISWLVTSAVGGLLLTRPSGTYLGLILVWAGPMLTFLWLYGGEHIQRAGKAALATVAASTVYLCLADRMAIGLGIWLISPEHTLGIDIFGLPLEEAVFFLMTNILVVSGLALMMESDALARRFPSAGDADPAGETILKQPSGA